MKAIDKKVKPMNVRSVLLRVHDCTVHFGVCYHADVSCLPFIWLSFPQFAVISLDTTTCF